MTTIGGPGGINGPKGPGGPRQLDDDAELTEASSSSRADPLAGADAAQGALATTDVHALFAEVAAGRLTQGEAIDRLADAMAGPALDAEARTELRALIRDLVANDPHLAALAGRI